MRKDSLKFIILAGMVGFAILYGMELASSGISNVYGPMDASSVVQDPASAEEDWTVPVRSSDPRVTWPTPVQQPADSYDWGYPDEPIIPRNDRTPIVDRISGKTAEVLHGLSSGGIRFVVSLFDKMTGS